MFAHSHLVGVQLKLVEKRLAKARLALSKTEAANLAMEEKLASLVTNVSYTATVAQRHPHPFLRVG